MSAVAAVALCDTAVASENCSKRPVLQTKPLVDSFIVRPASLLDLYPLGSVEMSTAVTDLVSSDPDATLKPILDLLDQTNRYQEQNIGAGLGRAARLCDQAMRPWKARQLASALRLANRPQAMQAFMLAYRGAAAAPPTTTPEPEKPTNPLGERSTASPEVNIFRRSQRLPDPFAPIK